MHDTDALAAPQISPEPVDPRGWALDGGTQGKAYRTELSPLSFLRRNARVFPDKVAIVHGERRTTYREFGERVNRLASALRTAGVAPGDRVAFLAPNIPALLEAHFGVPAAGAVLVAINRRLTRHEVADILDHCGARVVFYDHESLDLVEGLDLDVVRIDDTGTLEDPYECFLAGGSPVDVDIAPADEEDVISINYTSGTTGRPKGVMYTHRGAYLNALVEALQANLRPESVMLHVVPMFHCNGWCFPWAVTAIGGRHVCQRKVDPASIWQLIDAEAVTHANGAPTVWLGVAAHPAAHRVERELTVTIGGAPPSPTLLERMGQLNIRPVHVYGLTETYAPYTICEPQESWQEQSTAARARVLGRQGVHNIISDQIRVVDEAMRDAPSDGETMGEVVMRGNNVMKGYFDDPATTATAFAGGWFHSGDIAVMHPDGYIELRERKKDIIISGGGEHLHDRVRAHHLRAPRRPGVRRRRDPRREVGGTPEGVRHPGGRGAGRRARHHQLLPSQPRPLQSARRGRVRPAAQDVDGQGPQEHPPRGRVGGPAQRHQLARCDRPTPQRLESGSVPMAELPRKNPAEIDLVRQIARSDTDGPVLMLNLNKYKLEAQFPHGQLYREYMTASTALMRPSASGTPLPSSWFPNGDFWLLGPA